MLILYFVVEWAAQICPVGRALGGSHSVEVAQAGWAQTGRVLGTGGGGALSVEAMAVCFRPVFSRLHCPPCWGGVPLNQLRLRMPLKVQMLGAPG